MDLCRINEHLYGFCFFGSPCTLQYITVHYSTLQSSQYADHDKERKYIYIDQLIILFNIIIRGFMTVLTSEFISSKLLS